VTWAVYDPGPPPCVRSYMESLPNRKNLFLLERGAINHKPLGKRFCLSKKEIRGNMAVGKDQIPIHRLLATTLELETKISVESSLWVATR